MRRGLWVLLGDHFSGATLLPAANLSEFSAKFQTEKVDVIMIGISENAKEERLITVRKCKKAYSSTLLIIYDYDFKREMISSYFLAGVNGFLLKQHNEHQVITCIETILTGKPYLCPSLMENFVQQLLVKAKGTSAKSKGLSPYEFEIAIYLCQGKKNRAIAQILNCKPSTISSIKQIIFKKEQVENIDQLRKALDLNVEP